ncbi:MAG TPA: protease complex subunit PrcB family protein [Candidatus Saccharimonadia bacterium]|nr:protease complex subunit PrcB family protein [Candidatus Saccharimonadia bacterium]
MGAKAYLRRHRWPQLAAAAALAALGYHAGTTARIDSYAACVAAGRPAAQTTPPTCRDGRHTFVGPTPSTAPQRPAATRAAFDILVDGDTRVALPARGQAHIADHADWQAYWRTTHAGLATLPPLIPVDFAQADVIGASLGPMPTTGYGLKVISIQTTPAGSTVHLSEITPTITCAVAQTVTNRYLIVRTTKLPQPVNFQISTDRRSCK